MGRCPRHRRPANSERDRRRAKIEQRQNHLQHGLEARAVVRQLRLGATSQSSSVIGAEALARKPRPSQDPATESPRAPLEMR